MGKARELDLTLFLTILLAGVVQMNAARRAELENDTARRRTTGQSRQESLPPGCDCADVVTKGVGRQHFECMALTHVKMNLKDGKLEGARWGCTSLWFGTHPC